MLHFTLFPLLTYFSSPSFTTGSTTPNQEATPSTHNRSPLPSCQPLSRCSLTTCTIHLREVHPAPVLTTQNPKFHSTGRCRKVMVTPLLLLSSEDYLIMNCLPVCLSMFIFRSSTGSCGLLESNVKRQETLTLFSRSTQDPLYKIAGQHSTR